MANSVGTYKFTFNEHEGNGSGETQPCSVLLQMVPEAFARAVRVALEADPTLSDVQVTRQETVDREVPL